MTRYGQLTRFEDSKSHAIVKRDILCEGILKRLAKSCVRVKGIFRAVMTFDIRNNP